MATRPLRTPHPRNPLARYAHWLHLRWPAGTVERLPEVRADFTTAVPGLFVVGDLTGVPLLKLAADSGARAAERVAAELKAGRGAGDALDLVIAGGGVAGMAAALEAQRHGLSFEVVEAAEPFSTLVNFPRRKPIYTYPTGMTPAGALQFGPRSDVKEGLIEDLREQTLARGIRPREGRVERVVRRGGAFEVVIEGQPALRARRVIVAIGRSGNFRRLGVPGEDQDKVSNRLHDPKDFAGQDVLVVGGGDSALETAIALATCGAHVTLSYRGAVFSRPKAENVAMVHRLSRDPAAPAQVEQPHSERESTAAGDFLEGARRPGSLTVRFGTEVERIDARAVTLRDAQGGTATLPNDYVFTMIGREPPLDFFRRSGVPIRGEWRASRWLSLALILLAAVFVYHWKKGGVYLGIHEAFQRRGWFPFHVPGAWRSLGDAFADPATLPGTLAVSLGEPGFYYSLAYTLAVVLFGWKRIRRKRTPYVAVQTWTLAAIQVLPLFLLPYLILPYLGNNGAFDGGALGSVADALFPRADYGHGREYWRAFGLILAWPLFLWNVFTHQPMWAWLGISLVQTFVLIPLLIARFGKGAYCGWICSCGALAETLGDAHRTKMPHGPRWNRLNLLGQVFLAFALVLLVLRAAGWIWPGSAAARAFQYLFQGMPVFNYAWFVDLLWAGILGVGLYWHFSGRVWCRFACPLAALMHVYARFSRFRILADKKKCISCNLCTAHCHQGIDVMSFANKGEPMADPQCVRCSACVEVCPTGVLTFGEVDRGTGAVLREDRLVASPVHLREGRAHGTADPA